MLFQMFHVIYVKVLRIFRMSVSPLQSQEETYFFRAWIHNLLSDSVRVLNIFHPYFCHSVQFCLHHLCFRSVHGTDVYCRVLLGTAQRAFL